MSEKNIVESTLENLVEKRPIVVDGGVPFLPVPPEWSLRSLEEYLPKPRRVKQDILFDDVSGFIEYVKEYKTERTVLFANPRAITGLIDYHAKDDPSWCSHKASYNLAHTVEWQAWEEKQNRQMSQEDFAHFLDEQVETIEAPKPGEVLAIVKQFRATVTSKLVSVLNDNGSTASFEFKKDVSANGGGNAVELPKELVIVLKPYEGVNGLAGGNDPYRLRLRLKYMVNPQNTSVTFSFTILNFDRAKKDAFDTLVAAVRTAVEVKLFVGGGLR
jgi:uncharacterized protein YfdQ (DUF2303 family)